MYESGKLDLLITYVILHELACNFYYVKHSNII